MRKNRHRKGAETRRTDGVAGLPRAKKLAFSLAVLLFFMLGAELFLWSIGVKPTLALEDPYVGFQSSIPLFERASNAQGVEVYRTAPNKRLIFNDQSFPARKQPGDFRVFCMGGSTTYGRPYRDKTSFVGWLRLFLGAADPSRNWQVINCGGVSYASYRVASLMEELIDYEPDLFIVYSGHNEFLERRTYGSLIEENPVVTRVQLLLHRSRTVSLARSVLGRFSDDQREAAKERYRLAGEVKPMLDASAGLELYHRDDMLKQQVLDHYRFNLNRMTALARSVGAEVVFVQPSANLKDFSPFKSQHRSGLSAGQRAAWQGHFDQGGEAATRRDYEHARSAFEKAAAIDDYHAGLHYELGRTLLGLGLDAAAQRAFLRAVDEDVCPLRMLPAMKQDLIEVATQQDVPLVDFDAAVRRQSRIEHDHEIPGEECFIDHVHPTIAMHRALGRQLLDHLIDRGTVHPVSSWNDRREQQLGAELEGSIDERQHAMARGVLAKVLRWAGKLEEADRLIDSASDVLATDAEGCALLGSRLERQGQWDEAIIQYAKAVSLDPDFHGAGVQLANLYLRRNRLDEAITAYRDVLKRAGDYAAAYHGLGVALGQHGRFDEAIRAYQAALRADPDYPKIHVSLGHTLQAMGRFDEALAAFGQAIETNPRSVVALTQTGILLRRTGRIDEAIAHFRRALNLAPDEPIVHNALGFALRDQGDFEGAAEHYSQAIAANPAFVEAHYNLGSTHALRGNQAKAIERFRHVAELAPGSPLAYRATIDQARLHLASAARGECDGSGALSLAQQACAMVEERDPTCLDVLAAAYAGIGAYQDAARTLQRAIQIVSTRGSPAQLAAWQSRLEAYQQNGPLRLARP